MVTLPPVEFSTTLVVVPALTVVLVRVVILPVVAFSVALVVVPASIVVAVNVVILPFVLFKSVAYHVAALPVVTVALANADIYPPLTTALPVLKFVATKVVTLASITFA